MLTSPPKRVAIIGAGLSGLTLALALDKKGINVTLYELRHPNIKAGGALMLSPNALRVLDNLGVYKKLSAQGYNFDSIAFKNHEEITTDLYYLGDDKLYEYKALRVYRQILLTELRNLVNERHIPVVYGQKFSHIISEDKHGVTFAFTDGTAEHADILVGADGIHSTVRKYVAPGVVPKYSGQVAITCAIQRSKLEIPAGVDYPMPVAIHGKNGAFVMAPQDVDGSEVLAGTQRAWPEQDRAGWDALLADKDGLLALFRRDAETWPRIVQSALDNVPKDTLSIWPYYVVPKLDRWCSPDGRVIIVGDAAHAIPPTAGQGASQGFEDSFTLAALLARLSSKIPLDEALAYWKQMRQDRVDKVIALTLQLNNTRLPQAEREALMKGQTWQSGDRGELAWLYNARIEDDVAAWVKQHSKRTCPFERLGLRSSS